MRILAWLVVMAPWAAVPAAPLLEDSFAATDLGDTAQGVYKAGAELKDPANASVAGGPLVGWKADSPWAVNTGLVKVSSKGLTSSSVTGSGGSVEFRGQNDAKERFASRALAPFPPINTAYYSATLMATALDGDAVSLVAFTDMPGELRALPILTQEGKFYRGFGLGFKGDGKGGMDLVLRFRDGNQAYVDHVLQAGIAALTPYTIVTKVAWNTLPQGRSAITCWVNPGAEEPATGGINLTGFIGDNAAANVLDTVFFLQKGFGQGSSDLVLIDELRLAGTWADLKLLSPAPTPAAAPPAAPAPPAPPPAAPPAAP